MLMRHSLRLAHSVAATIEVVVPPFALVGRHERWLQREDCWNSRY
ncbi:hypothetical protein Tco_0356134, partial [Tanacetum coccineum]